VPCNLRSCIRWNHLLLLFSRATKKVFVIFGCTVDAQWADCINGLSAEWLIAAHPEERIKVNGMAWYSRV